MCWSFPPKMLYRFCMDTIHFQENHGILTTQTVWYGIDFKKLYLKNKHVTFNWYSWYFNWPMNTFPAHSYHWPQPKLLTQYCIPVYGAYCWCAVSEQHWYNYNVRNKTGELAQWEIPTGRTKDDNMYPEICDRMDQDLWLLCNSTLISRPSSIPNLLSNGNVTFLMTSTCAKTRNNEYHKSKALNQGMYFF